ncbi:MAG TPA: glucuronate isomerase [Phycisphaerae bacterium]|nr:glucuronate isomerase [Phycisphaerae bacterium]
MSKQLANRAAIEKAVTKALREQPIVDMHTHLYTPEFGTPDPNRTGKTDPNGLLLWGLDELLTYHYLVAEVFRIVPATELPYEKFWKMSKTEQADHIWKHLFVERPPISEACRGVLTSLEMLGLEVGKKKDLTKARKWFAAQDPDKYIDKVMELSNVESITMTNPVFDDNERGRWLKSAEVLRSDPRFKAVLRIDPILRNWPLAAQKLTEWGFAAGDGKKLSPKNIEEGQRFLREWLDRQESIYMALSLPPDFRYPAPEGDAIAEAGQIALEKIILPIAAERNIPFAMMIGSRLRVNPALGDAGDTVGYSDVSSVVRLCAAFPKNKFFVTMLARENQHELCIAARKFGNLMIFGCWWFLNNPSLIEEMTRMRIELLGSSMIPQHSDARVLDQLLYKWTHSRAIIGKVLTDKYSDIVDTGWVLSEEDVKKDVERMLKGNFLDFLKR